VSQDSDASNPYAYPPVPPSGPAAPPGPAGPPDPAYPGYPTYPGQPGYGLPGYGGQPGQPPAPGYPYGYGYGPPPSTSSGLAVLAHIGPFIGGFIVPLIIYLVAANDPFTRRHASEALNGAITHLMVTLAAMAGLFVLLPLSASTEAVAVFVVGMVGFFIAIFGLMAFYMVIAVIAMIRAGRREDYRYPLTLHLVKP
jgi:uncharacterized Tic20 family protein